MNEGRALDTFDEFSYLASHRDLISASGSIGDAAVKHYVGFGFNEGRDLDTFDEFSYPANYGDLKSVFGNDGAAAAEQYMKYIFK